MDSLSTDLERRGKIGNVDQSRRVSRRERQKSGQRVERMDARHIADVALDLRFHQVPIPRATPRWVMPRERGGISAADDTRGKCSAERLRQSGAKAAAKQGIEKSRPGPGKLALRQWMKAE